MPRKIRRKIITTKQAKYFKLLCKGTPQGKAALLAGYASAASAHLATKNIRTRVNQALFEAGLTPEGLIFKHLLPALNAEKTEFAKHEGRITDSVNVIAWETRLKAIELAANLGGYLAPREKFEGPDTQVNVLVNSAAMVRPDAAGPALETLV